MGKISQRRRHRSKKKDTETEPRIKPDLTTVIEPQSYIQNSEQSDKSIWRKINNE